MLSEVRRGMALVREWAAVSEGTSGEYFWVGVAFLEFGGGYVGMSILGDAIYLYVFSIKYIGVTLVCKTI